VLYLSGTESSGAAAGPYKLRHALLVNPHDIDGLKAAIVEAVEMVISVANEDVEHDARKQFPDRQMATAEAHPHMICQVRVGGIPPEHLAKPKDRQGRDHSPPFAGCRVAIESLDEEHIASFRSSTPLSASTVGV